MANDLEILPWRAGQLFIVENYWEAAGVLSALRAGITPGAVRRPFPMIEVKTWRETAATRSGEDNRGQQGGIGKKY